MRTIVMDSVSVQWYPGQRVVTREGQCAVVIGLDPNGNVIGLQPFDPIPRVVRPICDAWGGEHDVTLS